MRVLGGPRGKKTTHKILNKITIATLNVKGILKYEKLLEVKAKLNDDIILMQETHGEKKGQLWKSQFGRQGTFSFYKNNSRGVGALCNLKFSKTVHFRDDNGRIAGCVAEAAGTKIGFISVYSPNLNNSHQAQEEYIKHLVALEKMIDEIRKKCDYLIVGGDFNLIIDAELDAERVDAKTYPIIIDELYEMLGRTGLSDVYRFMYPTKQSYTFAPKGDNTSKVFRRLDYLFVSENILPYVNSIEEEHTYLSDHKILRMEIIFKDQVKGNTFWRHNDRMLKNPDYLLRIIKGYHKCVESFLKDYKLSNADGADPSQMWEYIKFWLGKESRDFCAEYSKKVRETTKTLKNQLIEFEKNLIGNAEVIKETKKAIDIIEKEEAQKIIFQSRVNYYENNEKPTGFFLRKIKQNHMESNIIQLKDADGSELSKDQISDKIHDFYSKLFAFKQVDEPSEELQLVLNNLPRLNQQECDRLIWPITEDEITNVLFRKLNPGKSPGSDGLTVDLYKKLWELLKTPLSRALIHSAKIGQLAASQKRSIIRLIQKKDKDTSLIKNWRPISLINVDAKILSRLLTARLEESISKICSREQLAYVKNRNISEGVRTIDFSICEKEYRREEGYILAFDFEKAFDSISHHYVYKTLKSFGFPDEFIDLIKTLYNGAESTVMNNGKTTPYFPLGRSCRQGDCLSPYLFIIAIEPLIRLINSSKVIKGFKIQEHTYKLSIYADDLTGFINNETELVELLRLLDDFGRASGLKLNVEKTEALYIGTKNKKTFTNAGLKSVRVVESLKVTGIHFGRANNKECIEKVNFESALNKMRINFNSWNRRDLSILGRVMLAKVYGFSQLQYLARNIETPEWVIKRAKKLIYTFVYKGTDKIKRTQASKPLNAGGINLPLIDDVVAAASMHWIKKFLANQDTAWAQYFIRDIKKLGGLNGLNNMLHKKDNYTIQPYTRYLCSKWQFVKHYEDDESKSILEHIIWKNYRFKCLHKTKTYTLEGPLLTKIGYTRVGDFFDYDGRLIEAEEVKSKLSLLQTIEWNTAVRNIKAYFKKKNIDERGFSDETNLHSKDIIMDHQLILYDNQQKYDIKTMGQRDILKWVAQTRRSEQTPYARRLEQELSVTKEQMIETYKMITKISNDTKSRSFLFKQNAGLLYANDKLSLFGYVSSKNCEFCDCDVQDINHLLYSCQRSRDFRNHIYTKMTKSFNIQGRNYW